MAAGLPAPPVCGVCHTHATLGRAAGVEAKGTQERLGHASIGITLDLYTHVVPGCSGRRQSGSRD